jgi:hypothetical protein
LARRATFRLEHAQTLCDRFSIKLHGALARASFKVQKSQATNRYLEVNLHLLSYGLFKRYLQKGEE